MTVPPAVQYAAVTVDELARAGVTDACLAPGSRSAPLAMALHADERIRLHVRHDERSAGFLALGLARASRRPVVVVCTSGSAVANLHPAVIEADAARVPLLLLTADRPPELRATGANQTIDQLRIFGTAVRWFCEVGVPDTPQPGYWRSVVARACANARGTAGGPAGPVHLNIALREPLVAPSGSSVDAAAGGRADGGPWTTTGDGRRPASAGDVAWLAEQIQATERGVIVVGDTDVDPGPLQQLAAAAGWPLLAEAHSSARDGAQAIASFDYLLRDAPFAAAHDPDLVVVVGRVGVFRSVLSWLSADVPQVLLDRDGMWLDPGRTLRRVLTADPDLLAAAVVDDLLDRPDSQWLGSWRDADARVCRALDEVLQAEAGMSEPQVVRDLAAALPDGAALVVGSSMPVRDLSLMLRPRSGLRILSSRGASGIDGFVSTALGVAAAADGPTFAVAGDLSILHDQNGLLPTPTGRPDLVLVVLNNDGGGIFSFLPQARYPRGFEELFGTPHGISFADVAAAHRVGYRQVEQPGELADAVLAASSARGVQLVEVRTDRAANLDLHRRLEAAALAAIADGPLA